MLRWLLLLLLASQPALAQVVMVEAGGERLPLEGHLALLIDPDASLSLDAVVAADQAGAFSPLTDDLTLGFTSAAAWLRFTLQRPADAPSLWWLRVEPPHLDRVTLYRPDGTGGHTASHSGFTEPWPLREIGDRNHLFAIDLESTESQTFYLRLHSSTSLQARLTLWQPDAFHLWNTIDSAVYGGYLIAALVIVVINLFYWVTLRQRIFLVYFSYVATLSLYTFFLEGFYLLLVQPESGHPIKWIMAPLQVGLIISLWGIFTVLLKPEQHAPRLGRHYRHLVLLAACGGTLLLLIGQQAAAVAVLWLLALLIFTTNSLFAAWLAWLGHRAARLYLVAFLTLILAASLRLLYVFGLADYSFMVEYGILIGTILHWVLIQLFVLDTLSRAKQAHDHARNAALEAARQAEHELEARIRVRTSKLQRANALLSEEVEARTRLTRDIELARQRMEEALEEEQRAAVAQRQFLRMVAHEFRTPLTVIQSTGDLLEADDGRDPTLRRRAIERFQSAAQRMGELVDKALTLDRFDGSVWRSNAAWIELPETLEGIAAYGRQIDQGRHRIETTYDLCTIQVDRELFEICIHNLVDNAIKYSPEGSLIQIQGRLQAEGGVDISVTDQGAGISEEDQRTIFGKYFRVEGSTAPGLGLGLYLVDHIARLHGGRVHVASQPGQGSRFTVHLPHAEPIR